MALDNFQRLRRQIEAINVQATELAGRFKELRQQMEEKHGVKNLKEAKKKLAKLEKEKNRLYDEYIKVKKEFESKWGEQLEQVETSRASVSDLQKIDEHYRRTNPPSRKG